MAASISRVCVYAGSNSGRRPDYERAAQELARTLAEQGLELVYGGANRGLMKTLAGTMLAHGAHVTGVMPRFLVEKGIAADDLTELHVVETMHERKARMAELADAFIALPGGYGSFEELFETLAWGQLALHDKPCGLLNVSGYYDPLIGFLDHAVTEGFLKPEHRAILLAHAEPSALLGKLRAYRAVHLWK